MCPCDTSAKIVKGFYENSASPKSEKISFVFSSPRLFLHKFFPDGVAKKKYKAVLDFIFCVNNCIDSHHCLALALADAGHAFCVYVFCAGNGHYLITAFFTFIFFAGATPAFLFPLFISDAIVQCLVTFLQQLQRIFAESFDLDGFAGIKAVDGIHLLQIT